MKTNSPHRRSLLTGLGIAGLALGSSGKSTGARAPVDDPISPTDTPDAHVAGIRRWPTAVFSLRADPRFTWCMVVPDSFGSDPQGHTLAVVVHGSYRNQGEMATLFREFAHFNRFIVLCPMFPVSVLGDGNADGYKYMAEGDIRYDDILLDMVAEFEAVVGRAFPTFMLFGFSGGGHFAHRFFYLHPERLKAVAIGAPGGVTLIDDTRDFPAGTRDFEARFGRPLDLDSMRRIKVQLVVGANDVEIFTPPPRTSAKALAELARLGRNRVERNATLWKNYQDHGLDAAQKIVPNCAHDEKPIAPVVQDFFLDARRPV